MKLSLCSPQNCYVKYHRVLRANGNFYRCIEAQSGDLHFFCIRNAADCVAYDHCDDPSRWRQWWRGHHKPGEGEVSTDLIGNTRDPALKPTHELAWGQADDAIT